MRLLPALAFLATACGATLRAPTAPGGGVNTAQAGWVDLADVWADRDVVLIFYRGHW